VSDLSKINYLNVMIKKDTFNEAVNVTGLNGEPVLGAHYPVVGKRGHFYGSGGSRPSAC